MTSIEIISTSVASVALIATWLALLEPVGALVPARVKRQKRRIR